MDEPKLVTTISATEKCITHWRQICERPWVMLSTDEQVKAARLLATVHEAEVAFALLSPKQREIARMILLGASGATPREYAYNLMEAVRRSREQIDGNGEHVCSPKEQFAACYV